MRIELDYYIDLPERTTGKIVEKYLQVLKEDEVYDVWTLNEDLEVVKCKGKISNNGMYDYHKNDDISENELYVQLQYKGWETQWWTLNRDEAVKAQKHNIEKYSKILQKQLDKLAKL